MPAGSPPARADIPGELTVTEKVVQLPAPRTEGQVSLEKTLLGRRSVRQWADKALKLQDVSQLLWAAQGVTDARGLRTAPSAGALYPLEIYLVAGHVDRLPAGIYHCRARQNELSPVSAGDVRKDLYQMSLRQGAVGSAPVTFAICAVYRRMTGKYGDRGIRYVHMEAGHAAQNLCLQAVALNLASVAIGAFHDRQVHRLLQLAPDETPLYLISVGTPL